jgi:branched-chain amino acid transport system substrate-binding protein
VIWVTDYFPGDLASFTKQFVLDPTQSLLHEQYGPSVPEFLELAGTDGNGVMWASVVAIIQDARGKAFQDAYRAKFNEQPGFSQGGSTYDAAHIYWQAASMAGGAEDRQRIAKLARRLTWRGLCGARAFDPEDQTARPYPHYTKDAGLGMPTLYFQIQDQKHITIDPAPFTTGEFQLPPWFG